MSAVPAASSSPPRRLPRTALGAPRLTRLTRVNPPFLQGQTISRRKEVNPSPVPSHLSSSSSISSSSSSICPCCCIERSLVSSFSSSPSLSLSSLCISPHTFFLSSASFSCLSSPPHTPVSPSSFSSSPSSASLLLSSSFVPSAVCSSSRISTPPRSLPSPILYRSFVPPLSSSSSHLRRESSSSQSLFLSFSPDISSLTSSRGIFPCLPRKKSDFSLLSKPPKFLFHLSPPIQSSSRRCLSSSSSCVTSFSSFSLVSPLSFSHSSSPIFPSPSVLPPGPASHRNFPSTPSSHLFDSSLPLNLPLLQASQSHLSLSSSSSLFFSSPWGLSPRCFSSRPGATKMKWYFQKKYIRRVPSDYFRYPAISRITRQKIDWLYRHPRSGYEGADLYGPNTIEVTNLPMGKTPEYLQERLWRYFGKFGIVERVRVLPHELDPYQTNGTAFVSFRSRLASLRAVRLPVHLPASLHNRILRLRHLGTDKTSDSFFYFKRQQANQNVLFIAQQLYAYLEQRGALPVPVALRLLFERSYPKLAWRQAGYSIRATCGDWFRFFSREPFNEMFFLMKRTSSPFSDKEEEDHEDGGRRRGERERPRALSHSSCSSNASDLSGSSRRGRRKAGDECLENYVVCCHLLSKDKFDQLLSRAGRLLQQQLQDELSVHWRTDRPALPDWSRQQANLWQHQEPLPEELQIWSRPKDYYKIHEERFLFKLKLKKERIKLKNEIKQQRLQLAQQEKN
ncbi:hypothetical protein CSUI_002898 [Cystoisospora suis]|uniref:RRM domain-containing protein n=1 Tax=Cystoisospora suis TaxID=483139 RepID=A0A2C6L734_9APIC|nr:hypothetical protein CSUI_002898 [Cystoisospora suis]